MLIPIAVIVAGAGVWGASGVSDGSDAESLRRRVFELERRRIEVIERVAPACVCVSSDGQSGGGSGVLIDSEGYGLTNFHVVASMTGTRRGFGGLSDGRLYTLEVLGVDITGDVAMFRLTGRERFPFAPLGDSGAVRIGDPVIAMGNPFSLAQDYSPTATTGMVTGVHRYQGEGDTLVYSDCIQTDASINPGNSGGPLFDSEGRVIGINGRISAEMHKYARGRYNVGLGYAVSIDQIKRFIPHLRAGLLGKHGTLLATVTDDGDRVVFDDMYENAPAWDAGIRVGDRLLRFGDEDIRSANHFASLLGTFPEHWPVPVTFESRRGVIHKLIRLEAVTPPLKRPYVVPESINRRALKATLEAFRRAVALPAARSGDESSGESSSDRGPAASGQRSAGSTAEGRAAAGSPRRWSWTAVRTADDGRRSEYTVEDVRGAPAVRSLRGADGDVVRSIVYDDREVRLNDGTGPYDADTETSLMYTALYALRRTILGNAEFWNDPGAMHGGGDALVTMDDRGHISRSRMLESVLWSVSEQVTMQVGLELDSHLPARVVMRDAPTGITVEMEFDDYRLAGGITWPHTLRVRGPTLRFEEVTSALRVEW